MGHNFSQHFTKNYADVLLVIRTAQLSFAALLSMPFSCDCFLFMQIPNTDWSILIDNSLVVRHIFFFFNLQHCRRYKTCVFFMYEEVNKFAAIEMTDKLQSLLIFTTASAQIHDANAICGQIINLAPKLWYFFS